MLSFLLMFCREYSYADLRNRYFCKNLFGHVYTLRVEPLSARQIECDYAAPDFDASRAAKTVEILERAGIFPYG